MSDEEIKAILDFIERRLKIELEDYQRTVLTWLYEQPRPFRGVKLA